MRFVCVLDFEATCDETPMEHQEVIEFPGVLLEMVDDQLVLRSTFQQYVKPEHNPLLTQFCMDLTGIQQNDVDMGVPFGYALRNHEEWLRKEIGESPSRENLLMVTCGDWDLKTMLPKQLAYIRSPFPAYMSTFCNLKALMAHRRGTKSQPRGMTEMLDIFGLQLHGRHHSGIDDCRNIASVCIAMVKAGYELVPTAQISFNADGLVFTRLRLE